MNNTKTCFISSSFCINSHFVSICISFCSTYNNFSYTRSISLTSSCCGCCSLLCLHYSSILKSSSKIYRSPNMIISSNIFKSINTITKPLIISINITIFISKSFHIRIVFFTSFSQIFSLII